MTTGDTQIHISQVVPQYSRQQAVLLLLAQLGLSAGYGPLRYARVHMAMAHTPTRHARLVLLQPNQAEGGNHLQLVLPGDHFQDLHLQLKWRVGGQLLDTLLTIPELRGYKDRPLASLLHAQGHIGQGRWWLGASCPSKQASSSVRDLLDSLCAHRLPDNILIGLCNRPVASQQACRPAGYHINSAIDDIKVDHHPIAILDSRPGASFLQFIVLQSELV
mmetsp:Transcript_6348/g.14058  ORF Transcript_6348/g.14058 Transcript_6348/m.14058 type:complete len:219 (+) Transcript_6348:299-955(+)